MRPVRSVRTLIVVLALLPLLGSHALAQEKGERSRRSSKAERNPGVEALERRLAELERAVSRERPEVPVELQIQKLADRLSALEGRISALDQVNGASRLQALETATEELSGQLQPLLDVIQVSGADVEIGAAGELSLEAGARLEIAAAQAVVNAALVELPGILKAMTIQAETVAAANYTPGAGNIW